MTGFSLVPDRSPEIILAALRRKAPEFLSSEEYRRLQGHGGNLESLPGLVCGAFTTFLCAKLEADQDVGAYFAIIEEWAATRDSNVENYLVTEVFENVRLPRLGQEGFKERLGPVSLELYGDWMEYPSVDRLSE